MVIFMELKETSPEHSKSLISPFGAISHYLRSRNVRKAAKMIDALPQGTTVHPVSENSVIVDRDADKTTVRMWFYSVIDPDMETVVKAELARDQDGRLHHIHASESTSYGVEPPRQERSFSSEGMVHGPELPASRLVSYLRVAHLAVQNSVQA